MSYEVPEGWLSPKVRWLRSILLAAGWGCRVTLVIGVLVLWRLCQFSTFGEIPRGTVATAMVQIGAFRSALDLYILDNGRAPTKRQGLDALLTPSTIQPVPRKWAGPYLPDLTQIPPDPWGNPYVYRPEGKDSTSYLIISYGKDGKPGGSGYDADLMSDPPTRSN